VAHGQGGQEVMFDWTMMQAMPRVHLWEEFPGP
jgi:hypothetical protein